MLLHQLAQRPVEQLLRGVSEDFLPRRAEKFQLAVETGEAQQNGRRVGGEPALAAHEAGEARSESGAVHRKLLSHGIIPTASMRSVRQRTEREDFRLVPAFFLIRPAR